MTRDPWAPLAKIAVLLQPAAVGGLMLEQSPSLTRTTTQGSDAALILGVLLLVMVTVAVCAIVGRYVIGTHQTPPRWMPMLMIAMAAVVGGIGAIIAAGEQTSHVLTLVYVAEAGCLLWTSHLTQQEIVRRNEEPAHA